MIIQSEEEPPPVKNLMVMEENRTRPRSGYSRGGMKRLFSVCMCNVGIILAIAAVVFLYISCNSVRNSLNK